MVQLVSNLFLNLLGFFEQWVRAVLESIALKAMLVAYAEAVRTSKPRDHSILLECQLSSWHEGNIEAFVTEGRAIQACLPCHSTSALDTQLARSFAKLMFEGKLMLLLN